MTLIGDRVYIRFLEIEDAEALLDMQVRNRELFQKYSPIFADDFYTLESKRQSITDSIKQREEDKKYNFGIFLKESDILIGSISLNQIYRGPLERGMIGYQLDGLYNGKGLMTEAVSLTVAFAFHELHLHRIDAGVMPSNTGSMRVLEKAGFQKEGIERRGVKINGQWEDHQIFAILSEHD
ncbi:GNAT family N-acetyltransferase [Paenibacillus sp. CF384]|uniref:GNAT family N-acetyltransferase n=1 Tax=Paenibacillus sp. CF384 TaxID=1884382 RepID=UPI00089C0EA0|nr:GNAT family protein [Paenibacillus sp. CF384]SDX54566.1 ribosomal-protein-alanine N-acetyltransferase [Paenibacillus sp. CF384]